MRRSLLAFLCFVVGALLTSPAHADTPVPGSPTPGMGAGCKTYLLCDEEDGTGACGSSGEERVAHVRGHYAHWITASRSTASTFTCSLYTSDMEGYQASRRDEVLSADLTDSDVSRWIAGPLGDAWVECSANAGDNEGVTVRLHSCPLR